MLKFIYRADRLLSSCNAGCACADASYAPVCGADGVVYYSPCHAGCGARTLAGAAQLFHQCACLATNNTLPSYSVGEGQSISYSEV